MGLGKKIVIAALPLGVLQEGIREKIQSERTIQLCNEIDVRVGKKPDFRYAHRKLSKIEALARGVVFGGAVEFLTYGLPFVSDTYLDLLKKPETALVYGLIALAVRVTSQNYFNRTRIISRCEEKKMDEVIRELDRV